MEPIFKSEFAIEPWTGFNSSRKISSNSYLQFVRVGNSVAPAFYQFDPHKPPLEFVAKQFSTALNLTEKASTTLPRGEIKISWLEMIMKIVNPLSLSGWN